MGFVLILIAIAAFYFGVYRNWDYMHKFVCKCVLVYIGLGMTAIMFFAVISLVGTMIEDVEDSQLISRLDFIEHVAEGNDYQWMTVYMENDKDYEEEFERYWERAIMYECSMQYRVYAAAKEAGLGEDFEQKANEWEVRMKEYCENPTYASNEPYGEHFMKLAGGN